MPGTRLASGPVSQGIGPRSPEVEGWSRTWPVGSTLLPSLTPWSRRRRPYTGPVLEQAIRLASGKSRPLFGPLEFLYGWFEDAGCRAYVKTVYVGFDLNSYLVGAIYVRGAEYLEVALALPADDRFPGLYAADHLKWASLPVALQVRPGDDLTRLVPVLERTLDRARHILTSNPLG
jgi:hypothetical protein